MANNKGDALEAVGYVSQEERKLSAEWTLAQSMLNEIIPVNSSRESWESIKDTFLDGRISFETWERFYKENPLPVAERERIVKDVGGRSVTNLCEDTALLLKDKDVLFFRPNTRTIIEIGDIKLRATGENMFTGFIEMNDKRFVTLIEKYADVGHWIKTRYGETFETQSLHPGKASLILNSHILEESLPQIQRVFPCPIPIMYNGELTFPKNGYDERFSSWKNKDSVEISYPEMPLKEAKEIIEKIYSEFCFSKKQDKINAISSLLTPFLRGMFNNFNTITPFFFYLGNREGVGKDYCAAIPGLVMDGSFQQDTPICDGSKPDGEELRKKITSAIRYGRKRMHFANNKGYLNSGILEKLITDPIWTDRILGKNEETSNPNELDLSGSGNIPIRYSDDLKRRTIFITQFYSQEDINAREFKKNDLHKWILENRDLILSALCSLVRNWINNKMPKGSISFASFEQWAGICGGIMESAGLGSPCIRDDSNDLLSGDTDNDEMKELWSLCFEKYPNQPIKKSLILGIVKSDGDMFSYFDFEKKSDQTRFGIKFRSKLGRVFGNIEMNIVDSSVRSDKQEFIFRSEERRVGKECRSRWSPYH